MRENISIGVVIGGLEGSINRSPPLEFLNRSILSGRVLQCGFVPRTFLGNRQNILSSALHEGLILGESYSADAGEFDGWTADIHTEYQPNNIHLNPFVPSCRHSEEARERELMACSAWCCG